MKTKKVCPICKADITHDDFCMVCEELMVQEDRFIRSSAVLDITFMKRECSELNIPEKGHIMECVSLHSIAKGIQCDICGMNFNTSDEIRVETHAAGKRVFTYLVHSVCWEDDNHDDGIPPALR